MDEKQLQALIWDLQFGDDQQRRAASYKLGKSNNPAAVPALIYAYNDKDDSVQRNAIDGLRKISSQEALDFLDSHKIQRLQKVHSNQKILKILLIVGSVMMIFSLFTPVIRSGLWSDNSIYLLYGYQTDLRGVALIGLILLLLAFFRKGTHGKRYAPWATILPVTAFIDIFSYFMKLVKLPVYSDHTTTVGVALPLCMLGSFFTLIGCVIIVHSDWPESTNAT